MLVVTDAGRPDRAPDVSDRALWDTEAGHLVLFDQTPGKSWEEKVSRREESFEGRPVTVWGM